MYNELDNGPEPKKEKLTVEGCLCLTCEKIRFSLGLPQQSFTNLKDVLVVQTRMIVCRKCGDKRCPHATNHLFSCKRDEDGVE